MQSYEATRLLFQKSIIDTLDANELFQIITPEGTYRFTRKEFEAEFPNVVRSKSYQIEGSYHYPITPKRAFKYLIKQPNGQTGRIVTLNDSRRRWNRDELLVVLNLYHKLRFGQFDQRQPVIIDLAQKLGRTPSAVAMKLSNLASLDPALKLRGIEGLKGASQLDREMWDVYHTQPAEMVPLSQERFDALFVEAETETTEVIPGTGIRRAPKPPIGDTETTRLTKQRRGQGYFRDAVLNNYDNRCAITGLPVRELLIASHILPWRDHEAERLNVRNGIALNRLHDAAFDQGLIAFDDELRMILSKRLRETLPDLAVRASFEMHVGQPLQIPNDGMPPNLEFLAWHRQYEFIS